MKTILKLSSLSLLMLLTSFSSASNVFADHGHCTGKVAGCDTIPDGQCTNQTGCYQKAGEKKCIGIPLACLLILNEDHCGKQKGCEWAP